MTIQYSCTAFPLRPRNCFHDPSNGTRTCTCTIPQSHVAALQMKENMRISVIYNDSRLNMDVHSFQRVKDVKEVSWFNLKVHVWTWSYSVHVFSRHWLSCCSWCENTSTSVRTKAPLVHNCRKRRSWLWRIQAPVSTTTTGSPTSAFSQDLL